MTLSVRIHEANFEQSQAERNITLHGGHSTVETVNFSVSTVEWPPCYDSAVGCQEISRTYGQAHLENKGTIL